MKNPRDHNADVSQTSYCPFKGLLQCSAIVDHFLYLGGPGNVFVLRETFPVWGSQAFSITYIHTQNITAFYVGIKLQTLQKSHF
jgi:hypothetical protein